MAGDVLVWAVSGKNPQFTFGDAIVAANLQGNYSIVSGVQFNASVTDVTVSGYYAARFDDIRYYACSG